MKVFAIPGEKIKPIATGLGSCMATDRITVDGVRVGYMYRELSGDSFDSGWRFFAGDEAADYVDNPRHIEIYDVNTIANYDPTIVPHLSCAAPCAFKRDAASDTFAPVLSTKQ